MKTWSRSFFGSHKSLLSFGILFAFTSSFGQTFFISLFVPVLQESFSLSETNFSALYAVATIGSAFTLTWLGSYIDRVRITKFSLLVILGLAAFLIIFSISYSIFFLAISLYGLRLFGQGLMSHTAITSMAKFFTVNRGKAVSIAAVGHPLGEAILPILTVSLLGVLHWRWVLVIATGFLLLCIPFSRFLLFRKRHFSRLKMYVPERLSVLDKKLARPFNIIKSRAFWIIAPVNFASAAIGTAFIFYQLKLGGSRGLSPEFIALSFSGYAVGSFCFALLAGWLSDIFSAKNLFPLYLIPFSLGLLTLLFLEHKWAYVAFISSIGITNGFGGTVKNVVLADVYGTKIMGAVRSLFVTVMVFSTALGPVLFGLLLDRDFNFEYLMVGSIALFVLVSLNALRILKL